LTERAAVSSVAGRFAGDRGVTEWIFTGTTADGKKVEVTGCDVFTFRNGKIAVEESYFENRTS